MKNETTPVTAPSPVRYYVGDLCYVMHDVWNEVCDLVPYDNSEHEFELEDGRKFILFGTAYGDGSYTDLAGNSYGVDSGTIGAIKVDDIRDLEGFDSTVKNGSGHVHEFPAEICDYDCFYDEGVIGIYSVQIDTAGDYEEEEVEYDNEFDEDGEDA
jgi:hypothetical protein